MNAMGLFTCARLLEQGKRLDGFSTGISLLALGGALYSALLGGGLIAGLLVLVLLCGVLEKYFAIRVALDAALFSRMAEAGDELDSQSHEMDAGLIGLGLMPATAAGRDWRLRSQGALRLLRWQASALLGQVLLATLAVALPFIL